MKIVVVQESLKNALGVCGRAVASSTTLAVLGSILLKTQSGMLKVSATNLEIGITQELRCKVEEDGVVCVPARLLNEVVANLPDEPVTLETVPEGLRLHAGKYRTVLKTLPAEEFPVIGDITPASFVVLSGQDLYRSLERVLFAVSTNETQAELCGVFCTGKQNELVFTATDRYRLAENKVVLNQNQNVAEFAVIIPSRAAAEVMRLSHSATGDIQMGFTENLGVFSTQDTVITTRLVDAQYPEYQAIVPADFSIQVVANRIELSNALKAVAVFAKGVSGVAVKYEEDGLVLSARSQDAGEGVVEVAATVTGGGGTILFNHKYLLDMFQYLTSENVVLKLNGPTTPVVFVGNKDANYTYLVMPIKT